MPIRSLVIQVGKTGIFREGYTDKDPRAGKVPVNQRRGRLAHGGQK